MYGKELQEKLSRAKEIAEPFRRSLYVLGLLTAAMKPLGIRPILVGGTAVEFYTLGGYTTRDIDLVINGRDKAKRVLEEFGFIRHAGHRHWYHEELDLALEIPDEYLAGSPDKVLTVEAEDTEVYVIGIEDLILDRLAAFKFWESGIDGHWAATLILIHREQIDWGYLENKAAEENLEDALRAVRRKAKSIYVQE